MRILVVAMAPNKMSSPAKSSLSSKSHDSRHICQFRHSVGPMMRVTTANSDDADDMESHPSSNNAMGIFTPFAKMATGQLCSVLAILIFLTHHCTGVRSCHPHRKKKFRESDRFGDCHK